MFEFEQIFKRTDAVQRHLAAPLLRSRLAYLGHRAEQGAKPSTLRGIAAFQVQAIHYLELAEEGQITPSEIATAAERWVTQHPARRGGNASNARRDFVSRVTGWPSFAGRMQVPSVAPPPHCPALVQFEDYMRWERGLVRGHDPLPSRTGGGLAAPVLPGPPDTGRSLTHHHRPRTRRPQLQGRASSCSRHDPQPRGRSARIPALRRRPRLVPAGVGRGDHGSPCLQGGHATRRTLPGGTAKPCSRPPRATGQRMYATGRSC